MCVDIPDLQVELYKFSGRGCCIFNKISNTFNYAHLESKLGNFRILLLNTGLTTAMSLEETFTPLQMVCYVPLHK